MTRSLLCILALIVFPATVSAQGLWAGPDDDWRPTDGPPILAGGTMEETATEFGEAFRHQGETSDSPMDRLIWWMATNLSPHIPVDPNCPPPDGCQGGEDPPPTGTPPTGDDPPTGGDDPPAGGDDPPAGGDDPPTTGGGSAPGTGGQTPSNTGNSTSQASTAASGGSPGASPDGYATLWLGDRTSLANARTRFGAVAEGAIVPGVDLPNGAQLRLVSKREADRNDPGEFQLRFEVVRRGRGAAVPVLVQAVDGHLFFRVDRTYVGREGARRPGARRSRGR